MEKTTEKPKIVAVIPCYNTEKHIANVITQTKEYVDEIVVVDDGSTDNTADVAKKTGIKVIIHTKNQGKGAAMKTGVKNIEADIVVFIDGDNQHDPKYIPYILCPILLEQADYVIGSRYLKDSKTSFNPLGRRIPNIIASFTVSFIISILQPIARCLNGNSNLNKNMKEIPKKQTVKKTQEKKYRIINGNFKWISDCTSGFTAITKKNWDILNLISNGFEIESELIFENSKKGFIIAETPISCIWGKSDSRLSVLKDGTKTLILLFKKLIFYSE